MQQQGDSSIQVLCVDDEPGMADLIGTHLQRSNECLSVTPATSAREGIELLDEEDFDCIVSDYDMPEMDGLLFLETVRADDPTMPFILFTGRGSEEIASEAITVGVTDYMQKESTTDQYHVLAQRITNAVERTRLQKQTVTARDQAEAILDASPNGVVVTVDQECVYANPAAVGLFTDDLPTSGGTQADLLGSPIDEFLNLSGSTGTPFDSVQQGTDALEQNHLTLTTSTGMEKTVEVTARRISWDETGAVVFIVRDISDRIEYESELEFQRSLLDSVFEASPDGIMVTTDNRNILTYNDRFLELWGFTEEVMQGKTTNRAFEAALDRVEDPDRFKELIERQYEPDRTDAPDSSTITLTDGTVLEEYTAPIYLDNKEERGHVWFYRDITELQELEHAKEEAYKRMTDAVYSVNSEWEVTFLNEQAEDLLELDSSDLLGKNLWKAFPEAMDTEIYEVLTQSMESKEQGVLELNYEPLGRRVELRVYPSETGLTVYLKDVTEQRKTAAELRESVETLHQLYEIAATSTMSFDEKQRAILELGKEYLDVPYAFVTELTESTQTIMMASGDHEELQAGESCPLEESYCRKTVASETGFLAVGDAVAEGWSEDPAFDRFELGTYIGGKVVVDGELYGTVCFAGPDARSDAFTDMERTFVELLTRWMSYEQERRIHHEELKAKNTQLEEFASIVSHDLRNPLTVAAGRLEMVMEDVQSENLEIVQEAHTRMDALIEDILTLAREGDVIGSTTDVELAALSEMCWKTVDTKDATLNIATDRFVVADESRLAQVFENLLRNAVEHGGHDVTITIGDLDDGFYLEDDGVGIPPDERDSLFTFGYTSKTSGTGIGLRVVKKIIDAHEWEITTTRGSDGGTRFEITRVEQPHKKSALIR